MPIDNLLDQALEDFPQSEIWRLQTDGWQAHLGPDNFRPEYYQGMNNGFEFLRQHDKDIITPELIEALYHSIYQFEKYYELEKILRNGYNESYGAFELYFPYAGLEHTAGVSAEGLDELLTTIKHCYDNKGEKVRPQIGLVVQTISSSSLRVINPTDYQSPEAFKVEIETFLQLASRGKHVYKGIKTPKNQLTKIEIASFKASREEIIGFVQADINSYYEALRKATLDENEENRRREIIRSINEFIRKLHQSHYFPDGNGRVFVFLLANLLCLQNKLGMKITENPAHYAAFSSNELLEETIIDLNHFHEYTVTRTKQALCCLQSSEITKTICNDIFETTLSASPLIALAQINELFISIKNNKTVVPIGYIERSFSFINKPKRNAHQLILKMLKETYLEKLNLFVNNPQETQIDFPKENPGACLRDILNRHELSKLYKDNKIDSAIAHYEYKCSSSIVSAL